MDWIRYASPRGFVVDHPPGWQVAESDFPSFVVSRADGLWFVVFQPMPSRRDLSPADVILRGQFPTAPLFHHAQPISVTSRGPGAAECAMAFQCRDGTPGKAQISYVDHGSSASLVAYAAPLADFPAAEPTLLRIIRQQPDAHQATVTGPGSAVPMAQTPAAKVNFTKFTDPQRGSFTIDVPIGWRTFGGLHHPGLGDKRPWFETNSPDGVYVLSDPTFPQALCHSAGVRDGTLISVGAGGYFLSVTPGAAASADCYLKQIGPRRLPGFAFVSRRDRPDIALWVKQAVDAEGVKMHRRGKIEAVETRLERRKGVLTLVASLVTTCAFNGAYGIGTAFWGSTNLLCVSPLPRATFADAIRSRMLASMRNTPAMAALAQQDDAQIYANANAAVANQWAWFSGQQRVHDAQTAAGDALVQNYCSQQQANDSIFRGWEQNQSVYDRLSQTRSDATRGVQHVYDDTAGLQYEVDPGSNHYWRDTKTNQVIGTQTSQPPDDLNDYSELRKG